MVKDTLNYFSFQPVLHNWCNCRSMYCSVCWMVYIKDTLLPLGKRSHEVAATGSCLPLSEWSFTICQKSNNP